MSIYTELISEQGFMVFSVQGNSMEPLLKEGDSVRIFNVTSLKPGDCFIFKYNGKMIIHRLAGKIGEYYYFIGDNSSSFEKVSREQIFGVLGCNSKNNKAMQLIRIINWLYLQIMKWRPFCHISGLRKRTIRIIYRSFHEKKIPETSDLY